MKEDSRTGFIDRDYLGVPYVVFVPLDYDPGRKWPAILFLHGAGETGEDGSLQTTVGLGPAIRKREAAFPYVTVFPQSRRRSWQAASPDAQAALGMLDSVARDYTIDPARVHLTGISMGGYGTWSIATAYPDRWASIVPICGGGDPARVGKLRTIPCWAFHGEGDDVIPVQQSREIVGALRTAGGDPKYTEFPGVGHNSWDAAYAMPELWDWMAAQRRA